METDGIYAETLRTIPEETSKGIVGAIRRANLEETSRAIPGETP